MLSYIQLRIVMTWLHETILTILKRYADPRHLLSASKQLLELTDEHDLFHSSAQRRLYQSLSTWAENIVILKGPDAALCSTKKNFWLLQEQNFQVTWTSSKMMPCHGLKDKVVLAKSTENCALLKTPTARTKG